MQNTYFIYEKKTKKNKKKNNFVFIVNLSRGAQLHLYIRVVDSQTNCNNALFWDRQAWANSVYPDQTLQNAVSDQGLHCLPLIK